MTGNVDFDKVENRHKAIHMDKKYKLHTVVCGRVFMGRAFVPSFASRFDPTFPKHGYNGQFYFGITEVTPHPNGNPYGSWRQLCGIELSVNTPSTWFSTHIVFKSKSYGVDFRKPKIAD